MHRRSAVLTAMAWKRTDFDPPLSNTYKTSPGPHLHHNGHVQMQALCFVLSGPCKLVQCPTHHTQHTIFLPDTCTTFSGLIEPPLYPPLEQHLFLFVPPKKSINKWHLPHHMAKDTLQFPLDLPFTLPFNTTNSHAHISPEPFKRPLHWLTHSHTF